MRLPRAAVLCLLAGPLASGPLTAGPALAEDAAAPVEIAGRAFDEAEIAEGAAIFERRCSQCHGLDGKNYKGPYLNGVVGRPSASVEAWDYSPAMRGFGGVWTVENLQAYLTKPAAFIPDVAMNFGGFRSKTEDRDKVIAFLIRQGAAGANPATEIPAGE